MLLDELRSQPETIQKLGGRYGARRIRVFGSVADAKNELKAMWIFWWTSLRDTLHILNAISNIRHIQAP